MLSSLEFRKRGTLREPDSIDLEFRLDLAANSPESDAHLAIVNGPPLTDLAIPALRLIRVARTLPGWGDFFNRICRAWLAVTAATIVSRGGDAGCHRGKAMAAPR